MNVFEQMLSRYNPRTTADARQALHEVMQQIALAGLYRGGFFRKAAFYGGTCLRIFHDLQRFSEDMDFSLLQPDNSFSLEQYFDAIKSEFKALGREVVISRKEKKGHTAIESAFLKDDTEYAGLSFRTQPEVKIKIEVDTNPPGGFSTESKLLLQPFSCYPLCYAIPDLFAGKMHAFLFRNWRSRVKGRDWYDFEWYVRNGYPLNLHHLNLRCMQTVKSFPAFFTEADLRSKIKERIQQTSIEKVIADVKPFVRNQEGLQIWSTEYFLQLTDLLKIG
ncbi:Nucleotidyl transferase AbiEii toxin, Type IV TA system [anaerobic digester metagenome]|jgi:predicted nucleotidyltransferase component of viral defense system